MVLPMKERKKGQFKKRLTLFIYLNFFKIIFLTWRRFYGVYLNVLNLICLWKYIANVASFYEYTSLNVSDELKTYHDHHHVY